MVLVLVLLSELVKHTPELDPSHHYVYPVTLIVLYTHVK